MSINEFMDPKTAKFNKLLFEDEICDLNQLKLIAWSGIPYKYRPLSWRLLLGYLPVAKSKRQQQLDRKREEYDRLIEQYYNDRSLDDGMWRQIHIDIPRMQPLITVFQQPRVQEIFERVLYIWSIRHPASGYVQGMNDLVTPFFLTFLSEHCSTNQIQDVEKFDVSVLNDATLRHIEADTYWSFGKLLDSIQNNYTHAQPGIQRLVRMLATIVSRVDTDLHNHLKAHGVDYLQFAFRWMNNLLIRELPLRLVVRLWDSYLAEGFIATFTTSNHQQPVSSSSVTSNQSITNHHHHHYQPNQHQSLNINNSNGGLSSTSSVNTNTNTNITSNAINNNNNVNINSTNVLPTSSYLGSSQSSGDSQYQQNHHHQYKNSNTSLNSTTSSSTSSLHASSTNNSSQLPSSTTTTSTKTVQSSWNNGSETPFSASFHLFVCAAFLKSWSKDLLREQDFQGIMLLLQNLPTYHWSDQEVVMMLADAYHLKETFSPSHLKI